MIQDHHIIPAQAWEPRAVPDNSSGLSAGPCGQRGKGAWWAGRNCHLERLDGNQLAGVGPRECGLEGGRGKMGWRPRWAGY